jgi:integrase
MAYVESKPHPKSKKYRAGYVDSMGKKARFMGTKNRLETLKIAEKFEAEHRLVRLGYRDHAKSWDAAKGRDIGEVIEEYLSWGRSQGGRGGRPWAKNHCLLREANLAWWQSVLNLKYIGDLNGVLSRAEAALRQLQTLGRIDFAEDKNQTRKPKPLAGKSLQNYAEALRAFCLWSKSRGLLQSDPLEGLGKFDITPKTLRRALTAEEMTRFFAAIEKNGTDGAKRRRIGYELALSCGLRKSELQSL